MVSTVLPHRMAHLSQFLLELYHLAQESPADRFRDAALNLLRGLLHFRAGWWGLAVSQREAPFVATAALFNLPDTFCSEYNQLISEDSLARAQYENPGVTIAWHGLAEGDSVAIEAFCVRYQLDAGLATAWVDEESGGVLFVSLYRPATELPFDEQERALMQAVMPHLVQAWAHNLKMAILAESQAAARPAALADAAGRLLDASAGFVDFLQMAFPSWSGEALPASLQALAEAAEPAVFRCGGIDFWRISRRGATPLKLQCGRLAPSGLTPREAAVATAFAAGQSYKQIAATLGLSPATVRSYLQESYAKLQVRNKAELSQALR